MKTKRIKVEEKKLGREGAVGLAYQGENLIEIDPRQTSKDYLDTLIHETLHILFPEMSEYRVGKTANVITKIVWEKGYRRVMS
jgi:hypothetical protein